MVTFYCNISEGSSKKAHQWLMNNNVSFISKRANEISKNELINILSQSEEGFIDILKRSTKTTGTLQKLLEKVQAMSFNEGVDFILENPELLKLPIIIAENKLAIGYDSEQIRVFIPKEYRIARILL